MACLKQAPRFFKSRSSVARYNRDVARPPQIDTHQWHVKWAIDDEYMDQLGKMGYSYVEGWLWYVMLDKTVKI